MNSGSWTGTASWSRRLIAAVVVTAMFGVQTAAAADSCGTARGGPEGNIAKEDFERGKRKAPELIAAAGVRCEPINAAFIGTAKINQRDTGKQSRAEILEIACKDDLGLVIPVVKGAGVAVIDCLEARVSGKFSCELNQNFMAGGALDKMLAAAGAADCEPRRAAYLGDLPQQKRRRYEVVCAVGGSVLLDVSYPRDERAPSAFDCLHDQAKGFCQLSTREQLVADFARRVANGVTGKCKISDARLIGRVPTRDASIYELACGASEPGMIVEMNAPRDGRYEYRMMTCDEAQTRFRTGCTLKGKDEVGMQLAAARDPRSPPPAAVAEIVWLKRPDGQAMSRLYPRKALDYSVTGLTHLSCAALSDGQLGDCLVSEEAPMGYGFADATMKMASEFKMRMDLIDVSPLAGAIVTIPIRFCLPG